MVVLMTDFGRQQRGECKDVSVSGFDCGHNGICFISPFGWLLYVGSGWKDEDGDLSGGDIDGGCLGRYWWAIKGGMACEIAWIYCSNGSVEKGADPYRNQGGWWLLA